jgi:arylformamidase
MIQIASSCPATALGRIWLHCSQRIRDTLKNAGVPLTAISGVFLLDGAGYTLDFEDSGDRPTQMYEAAFGKDRNLWSRYAPLTYVASAEQLPPFLILYVARREASSAESHILAEALHKRGVRADVFAAKGKTHISLNKDLGAQGDASTQRVMAFLTEILR